MTVSRPFSTVKYKNEVSLDCLSINYSKYLKHELELSSLLMKVFDKYIQIIVFVLKFHWFSNLVLLTNVIFLPLM